MSGHYDGGRRVLWPRRGKQRAWTCNHRASNWGKRWTVRRLKHMTAGQESDCVGPLYMDELHHHHSWAYRVLTCQMHTSRNVPSPKDDASRFPVDYVNVNDPI
jgi:hypothetical protein